MDKILVTGGAGFIGANFIHFLLQQPDTQVLNLDKLTYAGNLDSLQDVAQNPAYRFHQADICDAAEMKKVFAEYQPKAVVHFAAESHVDRSIDGPDAFIKTNITGTFNLLEAARQILESELPPVAAGTAFRFLHVSTDEVYGSLGATGLFTEETPYAPNSPYSASKAASDHLVRSYRITLTDCRC